MDGQDVFAIYEAVAEVVARARRGDGPSFIEAQIYRSFGNFEGDTIKYRTKEEEVPFTAGATASSVFATRSRSRAR